MAGTPRSTSLERAATNAAIACTAVLLFHLVSAFVGKIDEGQGLGWDGRAYAEMATVSLDAGNAISRARPLLVLPPRALHQLGVDVVDAFLFSNYVYAFALALAICALLDLFAVGWPAKLTIAANIALCIASSQMFAFYPAQVDLGALALVTWTFYLATSGRHRTAASVAVLAALAREFALPALLYGAVCAWRGGIRPGKAAGLYLPALGALIGVRIWAVAVGSAADVSYVSPSAALANLRFWLSPSFVLMFGYFTFTVLGGLSMALLVRPAWLAGQIRRRLELLVFLVPVMAAAVAGSVDIWRYLVFALPVAIVLVAAYVESLETPVLARTMMVVTLATLMTQRPFEQMNLDVYFHDWFPLYPPFRGLDQVWVARIVSTVLMGGVLAAIGAPTWGARAPVRTVESR